VSSPDAPARSPEHPAPPDPAGRPDPGVPSRLVKLGSVLGVPIFITPSWLLIVGFITISYAGFLRDQIPGASASGSYLLALVFAVGLGVSVVLHELGHTVACRLLGLRVRRIVVFLLGGVSELDGQAGRPRDEFAIAAAGPAVSFVLAAVCWLPSLPLAADSAPAVLLLLLAWSNLIIAGFNVLPGLPLDGGRLVQAVIWRLSRSRLTGIRIASWGGRGLAALLALAILAANLMLRTDPNAQLPGLAATVLGLSVAAFLWFGAGQAVRTAELAERTAALRLPDLVRPSVYLPGSMPVSEAMRHVQAAGAAGIVVIDGQGRTRAVVREAEVRRLPEHRRPWITLSEVSRPLEQGLIIGAGSSGDAVLAAVRRTPASEYLVVGPDGVSRGVLAIADLARALGLRYRKP